ncbi:MAG: hypothetical protein LUQ54_07440 [Methanoregula sp.]|nr:hypothetical protein [Methanoregula sp.]
MTADIPNQQTSQNSQHTQSSDKDVPRYHGNRRYHGYRHQPPRPAEKPEGKPQETKELSLDDEETDQEQERSAPSRQSRGGGRNKPPKKIIEEWANDIYCE